MIAKKKPLVKKILGQSTRLDKKEAKRVNGAILCPFLPFQEFKISRTPEDPDMLILCVCLSVRVRNRLVGQGQGRCHLKYHGL